MLELELKNIKAKVRTIISKSDAVEYFTKGCSKPFTAFDYETGGNALSDGLSWKRGYIIGTSFCYDKSEAVYIPWRHRFGNAEPGAIDVMVEFMRETPLVAHNFPFEYGWTKHHLGFDPKIYTDTQIVIGVYNPDYPGSLKSFVKEYYKHDMQTFKDVTNNTKDFTLVSVEKGFYYGASDSLWTFRIVNDLEPKIKADDKLAAIYRLENNIIQNTCEMHYSGIKIDLELLKEYEGVISKNVDSLEEDIKSAILKELPELGSQKDLFGNSTLDFNVNSPNHVKAIFGKLGIHLKGTGSDVLKDVKHPLAKKILEYRQEVKILSTYLKPYYEFAEKDNIVHMSLVQCGSVPTGRYSAYSPNIMAIPKIR